ncbi:PE family protein, partial [Streptomyces lunaelactis]|nr:PE family protein [Streptomyces lunaelactis]
MPIASNGDRRGAPVPGTVPEPGAVAVLLPATAAAGAGVGGAAGTVGVGFVGGPGGVVG